MQRNLHIPECTPRSWAHTGTLPHCLSQPMSVPHPLSHRLTLCPTPCLCPTLCLPASLSVPPSYSLSHSLSLCPPASPCRHPQVTDRNADWHKICSKIEFGNGLVGLEEDDAVILCGDLNYRIQHPVHSQAAMRLLLEPLRAGFAPVGPVGAELVAADQLTQEKLAGNVLTDFDEVCLFIPWLCI